LAAPGQHAAGIALHAAHRADTGRRCAVGRYRQSVQCRASIEQAVKRAAPLPYKGYEKVFRRDINFSFSYDG
jgi:hypothetical protein